MAKVTKEEVLYRPEDISLDGTFRKGVILPFFYSQSTMIRRVEYCGGLEPNAIAQKVIVRENVVAVRPSVEMSIKSGSFVFLPDSATLARILKVTRHNLSCPADERIDIRNIPELSDCTYALILDPVVKVPIHLRHPKSGRITTHRHPYPAFPRFTLPSNPWIAALGAFQKIAFRSKALDLPLLYSFGRLVVDAALPDSFRKASPPASCPSLTSSSSPADSLAESSDSGSVSVRKRKRKQEASNPDVAEWVRETQGIHFLRLRPDNVGKYADEPSTSPEPNVVRDTRLAPWYELAKVKCPHVVACLSPPSSKTEEEKKGVSPGPEAKRRRQTPPGRAIQARQERTIPQRRSPRFVAQ
ncbi:hypothetical protein CYLTODRAFT_489347 [Cylindrobasidium torrendii FP15055 ss-10]|uniref:Uncharacterized protein n=1 Tax=Cylindrobasidium torrendii FP15055 ss-10 TaxID=1314674 RepID=A0A0D7BEF4_9AGAR|nr:hypothetical protein CYLTODRAFT_489347 [Cylindrobasidium torrendii FP15055 ss-10]